MVSGGDFPRKHLNRQPGVRTGFRFPGPGPIRDRNGGGVPQNTKKTTAKQSILAPPFSTFPGIHVKNLHNRICFLVLLGPISVNIVSHVENHWFRSNRKARIWCDFRDLFAPRKTTNKRLRVCRYFEVVFKNTGFRENELNPPSAVRWLLEAFHVFQFRSLVGIPT